MELNPIFTMMLFPMGGAKGGGAMGHKLLLKFPYYMDGVQNPAVIKGVMFDAFDYLTKFHDIKINYSSDIRIHVQPDLQMLIGDGSKKGKMHWSWETFNKMLAQRHKQHKIDVGEDILQEAIHNPGREFLKLLSHEQQRAYGERITLFLSIDFFITCMFNGAEQNHYFALIGFCGVCVCVCVCVCVFISLVLSRLSRVKKR